MSTKQIRKFEQDAIVAVILDEAKVKLKTKRNTISDKPYKLVLSQANHVKAIQKKIDDLSKEKHEICNLISDGVEQWNSTRDGYCLKFSNYTGVLSLDLRDSYYLKERIANRVALALLPEDAINNIEEIIAKIANDMTS
tara:strand:+ start:2726 stop:3142 length:417 start_codon:yes stop_codon:yes gene_type:complete